MGTNTSGKQDWLSAPLGRRAAEGKAAAASRIVRASSRCNRRAELAETSRRTDGLRRKIAWWMALPVALAAPGVVAAQDIAPTAVQPPPAEPEPTISFSAESVTYDSEADLISASGTVRMARDGNYLAADRVTWSRVSGEVRAAGNVVVINPQGDKLIGENVVLTDTLRDGTIENLLIVLESGGRIAATRGMKSG